MTRDEILDVAGQFYKPETITEREVAFARHMLKHEREACAHLCEKIANRSSDHTYPKALECADAIRDRSKK